MPRKPQRTVRIYISISEETKAGIAALSDDLGQPETFVAGLALVIGLRVLNRAFVPRDLDLPVLARAAKQELAAIDDEKLLVRSRRRSEPAEVPSQVEEALPVA